MPVECKPPLESDFLDELIADSEAVSPGFTAKVDAAEERLKERFEAERARLAARRGKAREEAAVDKEYAYEEHYGSYVSPKAPSPRPPEAQSGFDLDASVDEQASPPACAHLAPGSEATLYSHLGSDVPAYLRSVRIAGEGVALGVLGMKLDLRYTDTGAPVRIEGVLEVNPGLFELKFNGGVPLHRGPYDLEVVLTVSKEWATPMDLSMVLMIGATPKAVEMPLNELGEA